MKLPLRTRIPHILILAALLMCAHTAQSQQKRAVVVGINAYTPTEATNGFALRKWKDLDGAVNDAEAMAALLQTRFDFDEVRLMTDGEATREAILSAIKDLEARSAAGDVALFYYAGHGSQVRNSGSSEADGLDETIVPADVPDGADDIRDKELRSLFNSLLDKGTFLTLIFDSCHSGSITRGIPGGQTRFIEPSDRVINDPSEPPRPVDRGALVFSSALDNQLASEMVDPDGLPRGAFSWALNQALLTLPADAPAQDVFLKTRALMKGNGMTQEPVIGGQDERRKAPLFGGASAMIDDQGILVLDQADGYLRLQGGLATGLRPGSELSDDSGNLFRVTQAAGPASSWAQPVDHQRLPAAGTRLTVTRWVASGAAPVRFHIPTADMDHDALIAWGTRMASLDPIPDPSEQTANHVLFYGDGWQVLQADGQLESFPDAPTPNDLALPSQRVLHVEVPAFRRLADILRADLATMGLDALLTDDRHAADYILTGRVEDGGLRYAWVQREATTGSTLSPTPARTNFLSVPASPESASTILARDVKRLNVIYGWLNLNSPPDEGAFPYRLTGFEAVDSGELLAPDDTLLMGTKYRIVLEASMQAIQEAQMQATIKNVMQRFLYVFALDSDGNGSLLWPSAEEGSVENDINFFSFLPERLLLPSKGHLFTVAPPAGADTFFLLSSEEPLPDPGILNFSGVRTRAEPEGPTTDLSDLLFGIGEGQRSTGQSVPLNWSIERMTVITAQKP